MRTIPLEPSVSGLDGVDLRLEGNPQFGPQALAMLTAIDRGGHTLLSSYFLLAELLVFPETDGNLFLTASYRRALRSRDLELVAFTERSAMQFARVRAQLKVSSGLAVSAGADLFVTADTRLQRLSVSGIGQIAGLSYVVD